MSAGRPFYEFTSRTALEVSFSMAKWYHSAWLRRAGDLDVAHEFRVGGILVAGSENVLKSDTARLGGRKEVRCTHNTSLLLSQRTQVAEEPTRTPFLACAGSCSRAASIWSWYYANIEKWIFAAPPSRERARVRRRHSIAALSAYVCGECRY